MRWSALLLQILNVSTAIAATGALFAAIGVPPLDAFKAMGLGAFGSAEGVGYTLFYATDLILAGLAVAIPFQAGMFNIGGEGQALMAGVAVALVCQIGADWPPYVILPAATVAGAIGGAVWALPPALLQVARGSHLVITTIMFNFIAVALSSWLLVDVIRAPGDPSPETLPFGRSAELPNLISGTPINVTLVLAVALAVAMGVLVRRSVWGYELRVVGHSPEAARYARIDTARVTVGAICMGGAFAGLLAVNELLGSQHRLVQGFSAGFGFMGIAVALMGRGRALGIVLSALLLGAVYQGGAELALDTPKVTQDVVMVVNGLLILFCGALGDVYRPLLRRLNGGRSAA